MFLEELTRGHNSDLPAMWEMGHLGMGSWGAGTPAVTGLCPDSPEPCLGGGLWLSRQGLPLKGAPAPGRVCGGRGLGSGSVTMNPVFALLQTLSLVLAFFFFFHLLLPMAMVFFFFLLLKSITEETIILPFLFERKLWGRNPSTQIFLPLCASVPVIQKIWKI